jgi:2'-5' RNA ligase
VIEFQRACEAAAVAAGFPAEPRAFRPHLTLGRWRDRARRPRLPEVDLGAFAIVEAVLYRSDLQPGGAVHTPLVHFPFAGPCPDDS